MQRRTISCLWVLFSALIVFFIGGCGGGGGGGTGSRTVPPYILATLISFPTGAVPPGFVDAGFNSGVAVEVLDNSSGTPLSNASVTLNGVALGYVPGNQDYEGEILVAPAGGVRLSVTVGGATYTASGTQFTSYPSISSPLSGATWSSLAANLVAWSSVAPPASSLYALGVLDTNGQQIWPSGNYSFQILPTTSASFTIDSGSLTTGSRLVIVGIATALNIPTAAPNSSIVIGGFSYVPITVNNGPTATLVSIAVTPATPTISVAKTLQLTATGTYSDSSTQDLTTQVTWTSSDTTKATVNAGGLVTGVGYGSATITARSGVVSGSATLNIFQPNPSPVPPLSQAVAYQIDYAHSGFATFGTPLTFPSSPTWSVTLNGQASYPLIAGGKVFVTTPTSLYALDELTGIVVWGPVAIPGTLSWIAHAYDHGKLFVVNYDGLLRSFDATTGQAGWSTQLPGQYAFSAPPTAVNGVVYVGGAGSGGTLYAVDESTGNVLWTAFVENGDRSSTAVSSDGVFVSYPCQVYKFDPLTGASLWHYAGPCEGGGGKTPAYANGLLYVRDPTSSPPDQVFDAASGTRVGSFTSTPIPALSTQTGYFLNAGTLQGIDLTSHNVLWSFAGDGQLVSAPIVIDNRVIVGSGTGTVYALDAATGTQIWSGNAGAAISGPDEQNLPPLMGFGAGEGYLVVPAGSVLSAWHLTGH
jgi:outer membrane protein assembly factor BamB